MIHPVNGRCTNDAYTGGLDTTLRTSDGEWGFGAQVVGSRIENGPTRDIPDGTRVGSGSTGWGVKTRGLSWRGAAVLSLRPFPALELDLIPNGSWVYGSPRFVTSELNPDSSTTYYFADLEAKSFDLTLRGTYAFTRTLSLQAYLQPFVASGRYTKVTRSTATGVKPLLTVDSFADATLPAGTPNPDFRDGAINLNLFVRWEYLPLSALWLVYTRNQQQSGYGPMEGPASLRFDRFSNGPTTDVILLKLSYLWF